MNVYLLWIENPMRKGETVLHSVWNSETVAHEAADVLGFGDQYRVQERPLWAGGDVDAIVWGGT